MASGFQTKRLRLPYLASSCRRVLISQMGLVAVMAVNPVKFRGVTRFRQMQRHLEIHHLIIHMKYSTLKRTVRKHFTKQG